MNCNICNKVMSADVGIIIRHLKLFHPHEVKYTCLIKNCRRIFVSIPTLKKHLIGCTNSNSSNKSSCTQLAIAHCSTETPTCEYDGFNYSEGNETETIEPSIHNNFQKDILKFIGLLYSNRTINRSVVQTIIENYEELLLNMTLSIKSNVEKFIPPQYHDIINSCLKIDTLSEFNTEYKRLKFLEKHNYLIPPESILIGEIDDDKRVNDITILTKKKCYIQVISIRTVLRTFLELENVFDTIINYITDELSRQSFHALYTSLFQGKVWEEVQSNFENKVVIPLYLYYDDFEICNPLSSAAGIYKIGGLYFSIAAIPPEFSSTLDSVFLAQLVHTADLKQFGNKKCFSNIIDEFKFLAEQGITININGIIHQVFFVLIGILGDNLGVNGILGFFECFIVEYFCRFCTASKVECKVALVENPLLLRDINSYENDLKTLSYGIKQNCSFNSVPFYHCVTNSTCDLMHDLYLGICRRDMAKVINHCIKQKYFSLHELNDRLKYFDYSDADHGKKISSISATHLRNGNIIVTAAEMSALVSYFGIMIGDLIPTDDHVWEFYKTLYEIIDVVTNNCISEHLISYLQQLIKSHNELSIELNGSLTPKDHFLIHYPSCIKNMGPMRYYSSAKFESFHQLSKKNAQVINSRVNITYTLALKIQLELSYRFLSQKGLQTSLEYGRTSHITNSDKSKFLSQFDDDSCAVSWVKINGSCFKPNNAIYLSNNCLNDPCFGIIISIILSSKNDVFFMYKDCFTIGFDDHIKGYLITKPDCSTECKLFSVKDCNYIKSIKIHVSGNGNFVISRRDLQ